MFPLHSAQRRKFCQSVFQANKRQIQSLMDSSNDVNGIAAPKLNFQGVVRENHATSKRFSILAIPSAQKLHRYEKCEASGVERRRGILLVLLFLAALGLGTTEVSAESGPEKGFREPPEHIKAILNTKPDERGSEDVMELFNYLHDEGEREAAKAKGKDVVIVFGDTGAGKSTLINVLWGCKMRRNPEDSSLIEVDPDSDVGEVAPIGSGPRSCTLIPTMVGDLEAVVLSPSEKEVKLSFYDMPGLSDNRGFEVDLATAITMKKIVENAKSVKFMMVYEYPIKSVKGAGWAQAARLFTERFRGTQWKGDKSLSLVITHTPKEVDLAAIKRDIKKYTQAGSEDLSDYACMYDPLNPDDRDVQLSIIDKVKTYERRDIKIVMKKDQLWESRALGDKIEKEVYADLKNDKLNNAKKKLKFAHGIAELGNEDLSKMLKTALDGVHSYSNDLISDMEKRGNSPEVRLPYLKKYKAIKENFKPYTKFDRHDSDATNIRNQLSDGRFIAWDKPTGIFIGSVATLGTGVATGVGVSVAVGTSATAVGALASATAGATVLSGLGLSAAVGTAVAAAPVLAVVGGIATVGCLGFTVYSSLCWLRPPQKHVITSAYFDIEI